MADVPTWAPGWFPDPTGRHDHRWWDGAAWTAHVADAGVAAVDPLPPVPGSSEQPGPMADPRRPSAGSVAPARSGTDPVAIGALAAGLVGLPLLFAPVIGLAAPVAALALGLVARARLRSSGRGGRGLAVSGIVLGAVGIAVALLVTAASVALFSDPDSELSVLLRDYLTCIETRSVDECQRELEAQLPDAIRRTLG